MENEPKRLVAERDYKEAGPATLRCGNPHIMLRSVAIGLGVFLLRGIAFAEDDSGDQLRQFIDLQAHLASGIFATKNRPNKPAPTYYSAGLVCEAIVPIPANEDELPSAFWPENGTSTHQLALNSYRSFSKYRLFSPVVSSLHRQSTFTP